MASALTCADYDLTTPWYTLFIQSREAKSSSFYNAAPNQVASIPVGVLSGIFLLLSGLDHLITVLPGVNKVYNRGLQVNRNPFRWIEYAGAPEHTCTPSVPALLHAVSHFMCVTRLPLLPHARGVGCVEAVAASLQVVYRLDCAMPSAQTDMLLLLQCLPPSCGCRLACSLASSTFTCSLAFSC